MSSPTWLLRVRLVPLPIRLAVVALTLGLPAYWWISYAGPFRWLSQLQLDLFGAYSPILSGALNALVIAGAGIGVLSLVGSRYPATARELEQDEAVRERQQMTYLRRHGVFIAAVALALGFGIPGVYYVARARALGPLRDVELTALEQGAAPPSRYVQVSGKLRKWDGISIVNRNHSVEIETHFFPVGSVRDSSVPAALVLEITETQMMEKQDVLTAGTYVGTLRKLPPFHRSELERQGVQLTDTVWLLDYLDGPGRQRTIGFVLMSLSGVAVLVAVISHVLSRQRALP